MVLDRNGMDRNRPRRQRRHSIQRAVGHMRQRMREDPSYISTYIKYTLFFLNLLFWIVGVLLLAAGLWVYFEKNPDGTQVKSYLDVLLDVSIVMMILGALVFLVSFAGCIGALRENLCLLSVYAFTIFIIFLAQMAAIVVAFMMPRKLELFIKDKLGDELIVKYQDDQDLQNFIDALQEGFDCCGISDKSYMDWMKNEYFNCSENNRSGAKCSVPFSCCQEPRPNGLLNTMCAGDVIGNPDIGSIIWTVGCFPVIKDWAISHMYEIAGIALGISVLQMIMMYLGKKLQGQIELQKSRWAMQGNSFPLANVPRY